jgi:hypothetical protein
MAIAMTMTAMRTTPTTGDVGWGSVVDCRIVVDDLVHPNWRWGGKKTSGGGGGGTTSRMVWCRILTWWGIVEGGRAIEDGEWFRFDIVTGGIEW